MLGNAVVLCILDGWGNGNGGSCDAIHAADKPFWDDIVSKCPIASLSASGPDVGLPPGQVGNSEVGHVSLGAGRIVLQDLQRINLEIEDVHKNPSLLQFVEKIKRAGGVCHIMGLLSDGGVHSLQEHIVKLVACVSRFQIEVLIHVFLDGRDTPPYSAKKYINLLNDQIAEHNARIVTVSGRYYAMDRDNRIDRTEKAYQAIALSRGVRHVSALDAVERSYQEGTSDEFLVPSVIGDYDGFKPCDGVLIANFRSDRILQLLNMILEKPCKVCAVLSMTRYSEKISVPCLFPPKSIRNTIGEVVSRQGMKQLRIAETEKYAHVTFFFNGGREECFEGEDRLIISSPQVSTYDLRPEMSAFEVTDALIDRIEDKKHSLLVVNYANADMVGHTGNFEAAKKAVTTLDTCLGRVFESVKRVGATMIVTADHGNAEKMFDELGTPFTAHTSSTVPFVLCNCKSQFLLSNGKLCDVAPTILHLMQIEKPEEMTGTSLLVEHS